MLISRVPDEGGEREEERDFQTASELFDLMAKDHDFDAGEDPLTTRDLVLLYKNIDLGKQLMTNVNEIKLRSPNQHVETVVYHDEPESDSELSESYSSEQLEHIALVNQERIDLLSSSRNTLCHKLGDLELQTAGTADYDRHFLFKDPYIKEQLKNLKLMSSTCEDSAVLPASLLDYICCRRLEDNYNFYMDNIIRYVKNTIEQLKRISNGDYLTDRAKQKWREVENEKEGGDNESKVLTASTSIPLHVERKLTGTSSTWDDLVHSEVDLRSLAKILEKRIVLEVPKLISGSYKLFSSRTADNLVISCARAPAPAAAARVDVVLQLQRSDTGHVVSNIDSIMILQSQLPTATTRIDGTGLLPLTYDKAEDKKEEEVPKIIELNEIDPQSARDSLLAETDRDCRSRENEENSSICEYSNSEPENMASVCESYVATRRRAAARIVRGEATVNLATPEDMRLTLQALDRRTSLPEESTDDSFYTKTKKTSPTRVRIKSPYENKSHMMEERKRRRLLEVKERRERKKLAMSENKVSKNKFCKSAIAPQASSSVTKLSITNKSFYNSIFGQSFNTENKQPLLNNTKGRKGQKKEDTIPEMVPEQPEGERDEVASIETNNSKKYINRSYYLDDTVTEMMYLQMKHVDGVKTSASTSAVSNDSANQGSQSQLSSASFANLEMREQYPNDKRSREKDCAEELTSHGSLQQVPSNTPKESPGEPAIECRRSIEKIYVLMKKLGKIDPKKPRARSSGDGADPPPEIQSDSGTSLKHRVTSSNPSTFSFGKAISEEYSKDEPASPQSQEPSSRAVVPKVIISSKQRPKPEPEKPIRGHRRAPQSPRVKAFPDNPLKAISQLLHDFDHVQKTRQKTGVESKPGKKEAAPPDARGARQTQEAARRRGRAEPPREKPAERKPASPRARAREPPVAEQDEARESRGEAVRGPPALSSRLHMLAQPRRAYVQALGDEPRYPRAQVPERAPRAPAGRPRARRADAVSAPSVKPALVPLERAARARRSAGSSPEQRPPPPAAPGSPHSLKKKMVAVESYVKQHYGRGAGAGSTPDSGFTARAPLLPSDIELSSMTSSPVPEESSALGSKLHRIIDSMLRAPRGSRAVPPAPPEPGPAERAARERAEPAPADGPGTLAPQPAEPRGARAELTLLDHALGRKVSTGAFPKRLRIKNLTLTPKHSLQRIVLLQSGDAASLLLESKLSQNFQSNTSRSSSNELDYKALPLSTTRLDWTFSQMPMQISTVGYAFPSYDRDSFTKGAPKKMNTIVSRKVSNETDEESLSENIDMKDQTCQCFKGISSKQGLECAVQAADGDFGAPVAEPAPRVEEDHPVSEKNPVYPNLNHPKTEKTDEKQPIVEFDVSTKEDTEKIEKNNSSDDVEEKGEILDYTKSLDMLVGLLSEIQQITKYSCDSEEPACARATPAPSRASGSRRLSSATSNDGRTNSCVVSVNSDNDGAWKHAIDACTSETAPLVARPARASASKEVSAQFPAPAELVSVCTGVPSRERLAPSRAASLTSLPTEPSSSATSIAEYHTPCAEIHRHISELTIAPNLGYVKSLVIFHDAHAAKIKDTEVTVMCKNMMKNAVARRERSVSDKFVTKMDLVQSLPRRKKNLTKCSLNAVDFDPMIKMKRDILVTMYSFLVLTVFAALSLPEMLHQT